MLYELTLKVCFQWISFDITDLSFTNMSEAKPERSNPYMSMSELPPRSLSYISERSSRPETRHDWAITQQFKHKHEVATAIAQ